VWAGKLEFHTEDQNDTGKVERLIISTLSVHVTILAEPSRKPATTPPTIEMKLNLPAVVTTTVSEGKDFEEVVDVSHVVSPTKRK